MTEAGQGVRYPYPLNISGPELWLWRSAARC